MVPLLQILKTRCNFSTRRYNQAADDPLHKTSILNTLRQRVGCVGFRCEFGGHGATRSSEGERGGGQSTGVFVGTPTGTLLPGWDRAHSLRRSRTRRAFGDQQISGCILDLDEQPPPYRRGLRLVDQAMAQLGGCSGEHRRPTPGRARVATEAGNPGVFFLRFFSFANTRGTTSRTRRQRERDTTWYISHLLLTKLLFSCSTSDARSEEKRELWRRLRIEEGGPKKHGDTAHRRPSPPIFFFITFHPYSFALPSTAWFTVGFFWGGARGLASSYI